MEKHFVPKNPDRIPTLEEMMEGEIEVPGYEEMASSEWYQELLEKAQMHIGNNKRMKALAERIKAGERVTIATIGGSITEGAGSMKYKQCYAYQIYKGIKRLYAPGDGENVSFVNAGVGGTPSVFGFMRFGREIVAKTENDCGFPDLVVVEYAVNDGGEPTLHHCYESMVKQILEQPNHPVVILLYSVFPTGYSLQEDFRPIGMAYDLTMVSMLDGAFPYVGDKWTCEEFFFDIYHPTTMGHAVMGDCVLHAIEKMVEQPEAAEDIDLDIPPVYGTDYMGIKTIFKENLPNNIEFTCGSFSSDDMAGYRNIPIGRVCGENFFHDAENGEGALAFTVNCKNLLVAYRSVNDETFGDAWVFVDGEKAHTMTGNTGSWGQSVVDRIFAEDEAKEHHIEIRMAEGQEHKKFTITAISYTP